LYCHPAFPQPDSPDTQLWRYLDAFKFRWLVEYGRLYMPNTKDLGDDILEGTTPKGEIAWWKDEAKQADSQELKHVFEHNFRLISSFAEKFRDNYFVSCWHMSDDESKAMWAKYTATHEAVAVKTSYSNLRSCLPEHVLAGCVRYIDYNTARLGSLNLFEHITHKDLEYEYENELRAVAFRPPDEAADSEHFRSHFFEREDTPGCLVFAPPINPKCLIETIIVHPDASTCFWDEVVSISEAHGLVRPVRSALVGCRDFVAHKHSLLADKCYM
jgi:hypothetical protein